MEHPNTTQSTRRPTVSPSEPERRQRGIEKLSDILTADTTRHILYPEVIHAYLKERGMDTDEKGFIVRAESGEYVEPYEFDIEAYESDDEESDTELSQYFRSKCETEWVDGDLRMHVTNLHGFVYIDETAYPVSAYMMNIERFRHKTGSFFPVSTAWSSIHETESVDYDVLTDVHVKKVNESRKYRKPLYCYNCEFTGTVDEWLDGDEVETGEVEAERELRERFKKLEQDTETDESNNDESVESSEESSNELLDEFDENFESSHVNFTGPVCPECYAKWDSEGIVRCESCGDEQWHAGLEHIPDMCHECKELSGLTLVSRGN